MEADVETETNERSNILYDFTIQAEWQQDPEVVFRPTREKSQVSFAGRLTSSASRSAWTFLRTVGLPVRTGSPCALPADLVKLVGSQMNWQFDITRDGHQVVLLQEQILEIRTVKDDFNCTFSKWSIPRDLCPQWRVVTWSDDGDMVAYSDSTGVVRVYDIMGANICSIETVYPAAPGVPIDLSRAVCGLIFKDSTDKQNWDYELLIVNYQGTLKNCAISRQRSEMKYLHTFSFTSHYSHGISTITYSRDHALLLVGGLSEPVSQRDTDTPTAIQLGITAWRILSDRPHYKLVTDYETDYRMAHRRIKLMKKLRSYYRWQYEEQDGIYKLCLSPSGQIVAAIHQSGTLTLLDVPSLRIRHSWSQEEQPNYNEVDEAISENPRLRKAYKDQLTAFYLTDVNWWSDEEVITARGTGAVTVSCAKTLRNLLGLSAEWFKGAPLLSMSNGGGFLGMECEVKFSQPKRMRVDSEDYEDSEDDEDAALVTRTRKYVRHALYYISDSERFQPPRKRPKLVTKTYRLVCLKSTTPEELYARKIENEEYGEALALAKAYGLDCDLVYQRQWRKTPVSVASIQDYLSKISKRSWVLHECLQRVPENIDAMRELLLYGLRGTDLEALLAIGNGEDGGRFILCDRADVYDDSIDVFNTEAVEAAKDKEKQYIQDLLDQVDFTNLTLEQKELCRARSRLVQYLNRLSTYEDISGGAHYAADKYDPQFFETFRSRNIVEVATQYARDCDWQALDTIFTYHGSNTLPHRLAILANFPETYPPKEFHSLLPEIDTAKNKSSVTAWREENWREQDWSELPRCTDVIYPEPANLGEFLYEENPDLDKFSGGILTVDQVRDWYEYRACEIEKLSRQVDHSLALIALAREQKHVQLLDGLHDNLVTMDTLVYECAMDDCLTFQHLLDMSDIDRVRLMMSRSSEAIYDRNIKRWLVPFLERCEAKTPNSFIALMREYLVSMAKDDLSLCLIVFQSCRADQPKPIISDIQEVISMALECIYSCRRCDQLSNAYSILECLPQREFSVGTKHSAKLHNEVDILECHLSAAEILEKHELPQTIAYIKNTQHNEEDAKALFTRLTRTAGRREPGLSEEQWKELLGDSLTLREKVYRCVPAATCYQIFVESLLCSSDLKNIALAGEMLERNATEGQEPDYNLPDSDDDLVIQKVVYNAAVELVIQAAQEYFDSSTHLTDISMELAKACLVLIVDRPHVISEELDLIDALAMLDGFGVNILPLQVRMCKDRLLLIQKALDVKTYTYKNSQRLLRLGRLLRVTGDTDVERDGQVLQLVAQMALQAKDQTICYETCQTLMEMGYPSVWTECKGLAEMEDFHDIAAKTELLSYAVTHCTPDMIEPILRAKCLLETQTLYERVHSRMADRESQSPIENPFSARGAIQQTKEILSNTNKATRKVLSSVSDKAWWKKTLKSLKPIRPVRYVSQSDDLNEDFAKQGIHPFYDTEESVCYINRSEVDYRRFCGSQPDLSGLHFTECLLYTSKLEETLSEGDRYQPSVEVLNQLGHDALAVDSTLGLAYLMALPNPLEAEKTLDKNLGSAVSLQLAAYYYAIQIYSQLEAASPPHVKPAYHYDPMELVQKMLSHAQFMEGNNQTGAWSAELKSLVNKLQYYNELLIDYNQAQILKGLNAGIDIGRFTVDPEYKKETILGLSMTTEHDVFEISLSLAARYNINLWDVSMAHLEFLFDCGVQTDEIESRMKQLRVLPTLQGDGQVFYDRMSRYVYPGIAGTDHDRLGLYYSLLDDGHSQGLVKPSTHVKLLKKVKQAAPDLDYKFLTDGEHDPLEVLQPVLTASNINPLAKVAAKLPNKRGGYLHPSVVYCGWAIQTFWQDRKKPTSSKTDWIHRYELCGEYLQKLLAEDVVKFIDAITFVPSSIEELVTDCRRQIIRRALKYSRQQGAASKKKRLEDLEGTVSWDEVIRFMQQSLEHLDKLSHPSIVGLRESDDITLQAYAEKFDLSRSQQGKLEDLYVSMVLDGQRPDTIDDVISVANTGSWTTRTAYTHAVRLLTQAIRDEEGANPLLRERDVMGVLRTIATQVGQHQHDCGELVKSEDVMTLLRPFCADGAVAVETRLEILTILEQCFHLHDDDLVLLILYRTEAVVSTAWNDKHMTEESISSNESRTSLFVSLLSDSEELEQFRSLISLLQVWPPLDNSSVTDPDTNLWCNLLTKMITKCGGHCCVDVISVLRRLLEEKEFHDQLLVSIHDVLLEQDLSLIAVKCLLLSEDPSLHERAVLILRQQTEISGEDSELFTLMLQRLAVASVINTVLYPVLVDHILTNQTTDGTTPYYLCVETIANQLQEAGYEAEAGSLLTSHRGTHPALRTFDAALGLLNSWLNR